MFSIDFLPVELFLKVILMFCPFRSGGARDFEPSMFSKEEVERGERQSPEPEQSDSRSEARAIVWQALCEGVGVKAGVEVVERDYSENEYIEGEFVIEQVVFVEVVAILLVTQQKPAGVCSQQQHYQP